jgi:hypothetical protein
MAAPLSPPSLFAAGIAAAPVMTSAASVLELGGAAVPVRFGKNFLGTPEPPPRVVIVPTDGDFIEGLDNRNLADLPLSLVARIWGRTFDEAWYLMRVFAQAALETTENGGNAWDITKASFDDVPDLAAQGYALNVTIVPRFAVAPISSTTTVEIETVNQSITNT